METKRSPIIPILAVCIWGSLYIASGIVLKEIPALLLLFFRFFLSSVILIALGFRTFKRIRTEDIKHFLFIGFNGYFLANAALMLGIPFSTGSFSSLINSSSPVFITMFAVLILGEQIRKRISCPWFCPFWVRPSSSVRPRRPPLLLAFSAACSLLSCGPTSRSTSRSCPNSTRPLRLPLSVWELHPYSPSLLLTHTTGSPARLCT